MEVVRTVTTIFIVPTFGISRDKLLENGFINAFIRDGGKDVQYKNAAYLLFHPSNLDKFKEFLDEEYERTKDLIDDYDYPDGYVVVVYQMNPKFKKDFTLIKLGKYSKTSPEFQALFPKIVKIKLNGLHKDEISLQYRVFNKTEDLKKYWEEKFDVEFDDSMEYWQTWIEEDETLNINKIKENV